MTSTANAIRWFTPEKADRSLPLVSAILGDIHELTESVQERDLRVGQMIEARGDTVGSPYQDELSAMQRSLEKDRRLIREYANELVSLGIYLVEGDHASIEFPAWIDNRAVRLCWTLGEEHVDHWREVGDPTSTRRQIDSFAFGEGPDISLLGDLEDSAR